MSAASLTFDGVSWQAPRGPVILEPVTLQLPEGRVLGVVGANGAGKSTFLRLVYRYLKPTSGEVLIDGQDIWAMRARDVALKIAAVLQEQPTDFSLTVREIVDLGRIPHRLGFGRSDGRDIQVVDSVLERLELAAFADRRFGSLSGGERQRVMVARALVQEPSLLVLDEPTNHLDIRHQLEVIRLIRDLDMTIIASLHDLNMARLTLNVLLSFAQFEREVTAERIRDKIAASKKKGLWMGGSAPLGYEPDGRTLKIVKDEALTIRTLFDLYLEHGSIIAVKHEADRMGLKKKVREPESQRPGAADQSPFDRGHVYYILSNPIYAGRIAGRYDCPVAGSESDAR
ncbi:ATP-binding cassette domain-containing protein [Hoeflea sp.]|uniref:ATP-binding cassette domain-containing protein n=1 Tax=Hoeflea sp. TaxID=1940281 RepID=UPI003749CD65